MSVCSVTVHFGPDIRLSETAWLRTVFAVLIGDVGVIIEDLDLLFGLVQIRSLVILFDILG